MRNTMLRDANLAAADLIGADLVDADLRRADLSSHQSARRIPGGGDPAASEPEQGGST